MSLKLKCAWFDLQIGSLITDVAMLFFIVPWPSGRELVLGCKPVGRMPGGA